MSDETKTNMKNIIVPAALLLSLLATALLLSFRSPVTAETILGGAAVLGLLSVAALEYRINWARLLGRS